MADDGNGFAFQRCAFARVGGYLPLPHALAPGCPSLRYHTLGSLQLTFQMLIPIFFQLQNRG